MGIRKKIFETVEDLESKVPFGTMFTLELEGISIALAKTKSGFYAFKDECPHNRVKLSEGMCNIYDEVVCPWHNYRFDMKTGNESSGHGHYLKTYHLEFDDDGVYLNL